MKMMIGEGLCKDRDMILHHIKLTVAMIHKKWYYYMHRLYSHMTVMCRSHDPRAAC